jgi:hypothetical protein
MSRVYLFLAAIALAGCMREKGDKANTASAYTSDSDSSAKEDGMAATNSGAELEAPRLIPAMRNQLDLLSTGSQSGNTGNMTAYKNLAGDLVNSMEADLNRVGQADSGSFKALSDSVMDDIGGSTGTARGPEPSKMNQHIERMRRLIGIYQETMRQSGNKL